MAEMPWCLWCVFVAFLLRFYFLLLTFFPCAPRLTPLRHRCVRQTEPVSGSLANVMDATRRPRAYEAELEVKEKIDFDRMAANAELSAIDAKNGLRQLAEALAFLHTQAKTYHGAVEPSHVFLTPSGDWKLAGLYFATNVSGRGESVSLNPHVVLSGGPDEYICPALDYAAPEIINKAPYTHTADSYALGILAWRLHRYLAKMPAVPPILDIAAFQTCVLRRLRVASPRPRAPPTL